MFWQGINSFLTYVTLNSSTQESIQSGWYVAGSGEDEGRAGFSKVRRLHKSWCAPSLLDHF